MIPHLATPPEPLVCVVIPTFDRPRQLGECLDALTRQTLPAAEFEVVVVDDGSSEPLDRIVAPFAPILRVRLVRQRRSGPSGARNHGASQTTAPLLAFTDDDCRPEPEWLARLVSTEREHPGALIGGWTVNGLPDDLFAATSQLIIDLVYEHFNEVGEDAYFFASNNFLCRHALFREVGGFDAEFFGVGAEDRDFCDRWRAAGLRLVSRRDARVEHRHPQTLREFLHLHYRYGRGAHHYQAQRRRRGTGTMRDDFGFHLTLPARVRRRLGRPPGYRRSARIGAALLLWQAANAVGFFSQALRRPSAQRA